MNLATRQIAEMLNVDLKVALEVQHVLECEWFDFSECSSASLKRNAKRVLKEMTA